jgi:1-acyl-sn-glycerol-3-phosphate acyltransferase
LEASGASTVVKRCCYFHHGGNTRERFVQALNDESSAPISTWPVEFARSGARSVLVAITIALGYLDYKLRARRIPDLSSRARAAWMSGIARQIVRLLGIRLTVNGAIPQSGLIISNHLSYLDIVVLNAVTRCLFVSKAEVAAYPIFGECSRWAGVVFVDRKRRSDVAGVAVAMRKLLADGVPLVLFPEGTTGSGDTVLPFKPSLFASVIESGSPVTPCAIGYTLLGGSVPRDICYWGGAHLGAHLWGLLGKAGIEASLTFGEASIPVGDRKEIARQLHAQVVNLLSSN